MKDKRVPRGPASLLCVSLLLSSLPAQAHVHTRAQNTSLQTQANEIGAGIIGVAAALGIGLGVGIYFALHPTIKGCVSSDPNGLSLKNEKDQVTYALTGATTTLKAGEVVKVRGRKKSASGTSASATFRVDGVKKTYGACSVTPAP
ncbi:MAG TPA: hypothetical protein VKB38_23640 [Terracidiphilus sp.]|nr:hypothetical protein [Terracidiphilus sp.]